jgi:hypothetical protein
MNFFKYTAKAIIKFVYYWHLKGLLLETYIYVVSIHGASCLKNLYKPDFSLVCHRD